MAADGQRRKGSAIDSAYDGPPREDTLTRLRTRLATFAAPSDGAADGQSAAKDRGTERSPNQVGARVASPSFQLASEADPVPGAPSDPIRARSALRPVLIVIVFVLATLAGTLVAVLR